MTAAEQAVQDPSTNGVDRDEYVQRHVDFHVVVTKLADNPVLEIMMQSLTQIVGHHIAVVADPRDVRQEIERSHKAIAADGCRQLVSRSARSCGGVHCEPSAPA